MKKRDLLILLILISFVIFFTAWEKITQREKEAERNTATQVERVDLEKRLAAYDLSLDSLSTSILYFIDSLKTQAAVFESLARRSSLEVVVDDTPAESLITRAEPVVPRDTVPESVRADLGQAMSVLPQDLTEYERKIAVKEIENTILAKFGITREKLIEIRKDNTSKSPSTGS